MGLRRECVLPIEEVDLVHTVPLRQHGTIISILMIAASIHFVYGFELLLLHRTAC